MRSLRRNQRGRCCSCFAASAQPIKYEPIDVKLIVQLQLRPQLQHQLQLQLQLQRLPWSCVCALLSSSSSGSIGSRAHKVQTLSSTLPASQHILPPFKEVAPLIFSFSLPTWLPFSSLIAHFTRCQLCEQCHRIPFGWHIERGSKECGHTAWQGLEIRSCPSWRPLLN